MMILIAVAVAATFLRELNSCFLDQFSSHAQPGSFWTQISLRTPCTLDMAGVASDTTASVGLHRDATHNVSSVNPRLIRCTHRNTADASTIPRC